MARAVEVEVAGRGVGRLDETRYFALVEAYRKAGRDATRLATRVAVLLLRYQSLMLGSRCFGMHSALPRKVFSALESSLAVEAELFASPLNSTLPVYASLFDTDRHFGSCGSFFSFRPRSGSFECNPVFSVEIAQATLAHLADVLAAPESGPLSFVVFLPRTLAALVVPRSRFGEGLATERALLRDSRDVDAARYLRGEQHAAFKGAKLWRQSFLVQDSN